MRERKFLYIICVVISVTLPILMLLSGVKRSLAQLPKTPIETSPRYPEIQPKKPPDIKGPIFESPDHGDVIVFPNYVVIRYNGRVLNLSQGGRGSILIPENSEAIIRGNVSVTIQYTLKNRTSRNFRFNLGIGYGNRRVGGSQVTIYGNRLITMTHQIALQPTAGYERFQLVGPAGIRDDTIIVFFNADLLVRIYEL